MRAFEGSLVINSVARGNTVVGLILIGGSGYRSNVLTGNNGGDANPRSAAVSSSARTCAASTWFARERCARRSDALAAAAFALGRSLPSGPRRRSPSYESRRTRRSRFGSATVDDENVAADNLTGSVSVLSIGSIPAETALDAYAVRPPGEQLVSFDTTVVLPGGATARPGDVWRYDGAAYAIEFDAAARGVPDAANLDAVALYGSSLLLSFDVALDLERSPFRARGSDPVRWHGVQHVLRRLRGGGRSGAQRGRRGLPSLQRPPPPVVRRERLDRRRRLRRRGRARIRSRRDLADVLRRHGP